MRFYHSVFAAFIAFGIGAPSAEACTWYRPVDLVHAYTSDLILEGRVADYAVTAFDRAVLRPDNVRALKGEASDTIEIAILADQPVDGFRPEAGTEVIVATVRPSQLPALVAERAEGLPLTYVPLCAHPSSSSIDSK